MSGPVAFVDSSAIVTLVDAGDASHAAAVEAYHSLVSGKYRLFTTSLVVAEAYDLLSTGVGPEVARQWLLEHNLAVYHVDASDFDAALRMIAERAPATNLSVTDAVSMIVMERLGVSDAFAVDPAFLAALS